jgi:RecB family exonuclease
MSEPLTWSPSRSWRWRTCPRQFFLRDVAQATPAQFDARRIVRGKVIHAGMEGAIRAVSNGKHRQARTLFDFLAEAQEAMGAHPAAARLPASEFADCLRVVAAALAVLDVPVPGSIIGVEMPFILRHNGIVINGAIDLALRTGPTSIRVLDWKSGKVPERSEAIEGHTALGIYSIAALQVWPWARMIEVGLYSVSQNRSVNLVVTRAMQEMVLERLSRDFHAAHHAKARLSPETFDETFPAKSGDHCTSCVFRSYCPQFAGVQLPTRPEVDVAAERERIATRISLSG